MVYVLLYSSLNYIPYLTLRQVYRTAGVDLIFSIKSTQEGSSRKTNSLARGASLKAYSMCFIVSQVFQYHLLGIMYNLFALP